MNNEKKMIGAKTNTCKPRKKSAPSFPKDGKN